MMRKTLASALFILISVISMAAIKDKTKIDSSDTKGISKALTDTSLVILGIGADPALSYQNLVFKRRLDSIQKDVPLDYNEYVQHYIDVFTSRGKEKISRMLGLSQYYFPIYEKILKEKNIPQEVKFLSVIESALDPYAVSRVGATGLWQFMFTTGKGYGLKIDRWVDERKDPVASTSAAAAYLRDAYDQFGDWLLAIASYNCGMGRVARAIQKAGGKRNFWSIRSLLPVETQNYVPAFIATAYVMNYYSKHAIEPAQPQFPIQTEVFRVSQQISLASIAKATDLDLKQLSLLNSSYTKKIVNGTPRDPKNVVIPVVDNSVYSSLYEVFNNNVQAETPVLLAAVKKEPESNAKPGYYKVKSGETLLGIATKFNVEVQDLKVWNELKQTTIVPGQLLKISGADAGVLRTSKYMAYRVQPGDTLLKIAAKFKGVTVSGLKAVNGVENNSLKPGMLLKIVKG
ncbi:transglycosylase SLT domain-containing protein [Rubrolithibacter danxiaensis]|uniref:transglycosylase SLT domain-containing protein n=1 Tax=Rubrolithibacter danxiaensis TaxID=3390805 RepID=UPI003BF7C38F